MGFWERRQHKREVNALRMLQIFERTHSFEKPTIHDQPELAWHQSDARRNWNSIQATLGSIATLEPVPQNHVHLVPQAVLIMHIPEQPKATDINLVEAEIAS